jgi:plasmid replication initiation protein
MKTIIQIQEQYIETVNAGIARWSHRKDGGHSGRITRGAKRKADNELAKMGFATAEREQIIKDARDMAELERIANA